MTRAIIAILLLSGCAAPSQIDVIRDRREVLCDLPAGGGWAESYVGTNTNDACRSIGGIPKPYRGGPGGR